MKLMRVGISGRERPAVLVDQSTYVDVSDQFADYDGAFFESGGVEALRVVVDERVRSGDTHDLDGQRIGAPISRPHQILCIGLNYTDHAHETGQAIPEEPIVFNKAPNTLVGPDDEVRIPPGSTQTDWEVELGIVIGQRCRYLKDEAMASERIAGYVLVNDVSERHYQMHRGGQWVKGKSAETFNPAGPYLVTPDEIGDPSALRLWLEVNGELRQDGNTATMIFSPAFIVHYLSQFMVLEPGDLINTGTPPGVGLGMKPPRYLSPGDVMTVGGTGLGTQRQSLVAAPAER